MKLAQGRIAGLLLIFAVFTTVESPAFADSSTPSAPAAEAKSNSISVSHKPLGKVQAGKSMVTKQERVDRAIDEMAASSRETAILNLKRMLKLKRGTPEEAMLIWRLADMEWRSSKSYSRLGVVSDSGSAKAGADHRFEELLESCVAHTTEVLTRFPKFASIRDVLIRRGRAFDELKKKDYALRDFLDYISKYPDEKGTVEVRLMASDILAEQSRHKDILSVLKPVNVDSNLTGLEGQVVEKQALANFNVENYPEAIRKAEWLLRYDRARGLNKEVGGHYEEVVGMVALFYGTAFEKRLAGYSLEHAMEYFKKLEGGAVFGKVSHEFILVMRSKEMQAETLAWKDLALEKAPKSYGTLWILVDVYDAIIGWKDYAKFNNIYKDFDAFFVNNPGAIAKAHEEEWFKKFKKSLLEYADKIYATLPKKDPNENDYKVIQAPYLLTLNAYMRITDPRDELKARVRFRIGEFYANVKDWDRAQAAFTDVYQARLFTVKEAELRDQARLRAMTARYDAFKEKGIIPQSLKAAKLASPKKALPGDVTEWIKWVDEVSAQKTSQPEVMDKLLFEANRVVYSYGDVDTAYKRMLGYVGTRPNSKLTPAVCALIIDTLIESEAWVATRTLAIKFQQMPNVATGEFKTKLVQLERDSHYKITMGVYKNKDFPKAKAFGEEHLKLYPDSKYKVEILAMMGKISLELKDTDASLAYMNQVIALAPNHESVGVAYFVRATDAEKKFYFKQAFDDYSKVAKLPAERRGISEADLPALKKKIFFLGLVSDDSKVQESLQKNPEFCGKDHSDSFRSECERLEAVAAIENPDEKRSGWAFVELGDKAPKDVKAAWYAAALARGAALPNSVLISTAESFQKSFDKLDAMTQMEVLMTLPRIIPNVFAKKMETVETNSELAKRVDDLQRTLNKRVREVQGLEKVAASLITLPSPEMRIKVLGSLAKAYEKIADHLKTMKAPKGFKEEEVAVFNQAIGTLLEPLSQKVAQIGNQSWDLAKSNGLLSPWWDAGVEQNYGALYSDFDANWKADAAYLDGLTDAGKNSAWAAAVKQKRTRPMIFFFQISQTPQAEKLALDDSDKALLQFATLRTMGLDSEAASLLKEREPNLKGNALRLGLLTRVYQNVVARSVEGTRAARKAFLDRHQDTNGREEGRIMKMADRIEDTTVALVEKAQADDKVKAAADAAKSKADAEEMKKRAPANTKLAPKNSRAVDAVPEKDEK
jgi:tetratricopeptide (TPR) repeat protein